MPYFRIWAFVKVALLLAERLSASEEELCSIELDNLNKRMGLLTNEHRQILNTISKKDALPSDLKK
jgi:hypothetical protein